MIRIDTYDPLEARFLQQIADGDQVARAVYADWLEEHGHNLRAEYVRTQHEMLGAIDPTIFDEHARRLAILAAAVDPRWADRVTSPAIRERVARRNRQLRRHDRDRDPDPAPDPDPDLAGAWIRPTSFAPPPPGTGELPAQLRYLEKLVPRTPPEPMAMKPRGGRR